MSNPRSTALTLESGPSGWSVAWAHARRLLRSWLRQPGMIVQTVLLPLGLLFTLDLTLGDTVTALRGGQDQLPSTVALAMVISAAYGSMSAAISCDEERRDGLLARFWVLPTPRWAVIAGRLCAEVVRTLVGSIARAIRIGSARQLRTTKSRRVASYRFASHARTASFAG